MAANFTKSKDGVRRVTKRLEVRIEEDLVRWVQSLLLCSEDRALKIILEKYEEALRRPMHFSWGFDPEIRDVQLYDDTETAKKDGVIIWGSKDEES